MTSRERVLKTLNFEEPDSVLIRIPPENIVTAYETAQEIGRYPIEEG